MNPLKRISSIFACALILAVILSLAGEMHGDLNAQAQAGVTWTTHSESFNAQSSDTTGGDTTESGSSSNSSEQHSSDGQDLTDNSWGKQNADGSSEEHEQFTYNDGTGDKGGGSRSDETKDPQGNRKVHREGIWKENGKCERWIIDEEYDSHGKLIKQDKKTEPCDLYNLVVDFKGQAAIPSLGEVTYGPNSVTIPLKTTGDRTYEGSYAGQFNVTVMGECNGVGSYPVTFDVTAVEDEFDSMDVKVNTSMGISFAGACDEASGSVNVPPMSGTLSFTLPAEEGASKVYPVGSPTVLTLTFTLRRNPQ